MKVKNNFLGSAIVNNGFWMVKIESALHGDMQRRAEMTRPAHKCE